MTLLAWLFLVIAVVCAVLLVWTFLPGSDPEDGDLEDPTTLDVQNHRGD